MLDAVAPLELATIGTFAAAVLAIVLSPGPDTLLILRLTLAGGTTPGLAAVAGVQAGLFVHTALAATGLGVLIAASPSLFNTIGIAGALYIGWLGIAALKGGTLLSPISHQPQGVTHSARRAFLDALLTNLLNPKVILLFLALFPGFIKPERGHAATQALLLGGVLIVINVAWQAPMVLAAETARRWLLRPAVALALARATGLAFIAIAVVLLAQHWPGDRP